MMTVINLYLGCAALILMLIEDAVRLDEETERDGRATES